MLSKFLSEGIMLLTQVAGAILTGTGGGGYSILLLVVMMVVLYFLMIRPENKRKKEAAKLRSGLAVGDTVTTISGVVGTI